MTTRTHHYVLGHVALRQICQQDPLWFFGIMGSPRRNEFLQDVWRQICDNCNAGGTAIFDITDVGIRVCRLKGFPSIVVTMPPPTRRAEAHFVAIILTVDVKAKPVQPPLHFRYFTLEKGVGLDGRECTVLGEWAEDGLHCNLGDGPPATELEFIHAILTLI